MKSKTLEWDPRTMAIIFMIVVYGSVVITNAWMADDAYFTFRTLDNFFHGSGLTWNPGIRVQSYTHPLWMILNGVFFGLTHESYFTNLILSITISLIAVYLFASRISGSPWISALGIGIFSISKTFIDFSTSGLENPLSHLLIILFCWVYLSKKLSLNKMLLLSFLACLGMLNRIDLALIYLPALAYTWWRLHRLKELGNIILGFLPLLVWECFSLVYYGFPYPNTAFAKLDTGIERYELILQGFLYILSLINLDKLGVVITIAGCLTIMFTNDTRQKMIGIGIVLYLTYLILIGGDFLGSRFLSVPLLCAVILLTNQLLDAPKPVGWVLIVGVALIGLTSRLSPLTSDSKYGGNLAQAVDQHGVADERMYYYPTSGLLLAQRNPWWPECGETIRNITPYILPATTPEGQNVLVSRAAGKNGYCVQQQAYILDTYGLGDPLLAHLPSVHVPKWRIGHFTRTIPAGYQESLQSGTNQITDQKLARFYDLLTTIVRGPLFSRERWITILKMNLGLYDNLIDRMAYQYPLRKTVLLSQINQLKPDGTPWNQEGNFILTLDGVLIDLENETHAPYIEIGIDSKNVYQIRYFRQGKELGRQLSHPPLMPAGEGIITRRIEVLNIAVQRGYDSVWIMPVMGNNEYGISFLQLLTKQN